MCTTALVPQLTKQLLTCFSTLSVTERGRLSKVISSFSLQPYVEESEQNNLVLFFRITLWDKSYLPAGILDALQRLTNPEEAISVTIWGERDGRWAQRVSDNHDLVNSVDVRSGSTYKMHFTKEESCYYDIHIKSLSAASTYLLIIGINKKVPGSHKSNIMVRLV